MKLLWGGCQQSGVNIGNDLAPTGSVSNTVWNILDEFQRSEADWTRCTKPLWKKIPNLVILSPLVPYICIGELGQHWLGWWLLACSAPIHYMDQCWLTINWTLGNNLQWNCYRNSNTFIEETFENVVCNFPIINGILYSCLTCIWSRNV